MNGENFQEKQKHISLFYGQEGTLVPAYKTRITSIKDADGELQFCLKTLHHPSNNFGKEHIIIGYRI